MLAFLVLAEAPLLFFTAYMAVQNDRLQSFDALSQTRVHQQVSLRQLQHDIGAALQVAAALDTLPLEVMASPGSCDTVARSVLALVGNRVLSATLLNADQQPVCTSLNRSADRTELLDIMHHATAGSAGKLISLQGEMFVAAPVQPGHGVATVVMQVIRQGDVGALLWVDNGSGPVAVNGASNDALPVKAAATMLQESGVRRRGRDGNLYLYSQTAMPAPLRGELLAASDIRAATRSSDIQLAVRLSEIAVLFAAELALIAAGMNVVLTTPLRQLNLAVQRWQGGGGFQDQAAQSDTREFRDLCASFAAAAASLSERERELGTALKQQELLMREIHHRVKNNLQIIASLLNLQASRIKMPEVRAEFQASRDRVRALATLHRHLYADDKVDSIGMRAFFAELCGQLLQAAGETEGNRIDLDINALDVRVSSDQAVPIALVVTEIVGNALKHAFPDHRHGRICVRLEEQAGSAVLTVGDDGVGTPAEPGAGGLGTQLIRGFVRQLGATMQVSHEAGTWYTIRMPLQGQQLEPAAASAD